VNSGKHLLAAVFPPFCFLPFPLSTATASAVLFLFNVIETNFLRASSTLEFSHRLDPEKTLSKIAVDQTAHCLQGIKAVIARARRSHSGCKGLCRAIVSFLA
jgi:hypothetical protein